MRKLSNGPASVDESEAEVEAVEDDEKDGLEEMIGGGEKCGPRSLLLLGGFEGRRRRSKGMVVVVEVEEEEDCL